MNLDDIEREFWGDQREQPTRVRLARVVKALRDEIAGQFGFNERWNVGAVVGAFDDILASDGVEAADEGSGKQSTQMSPSPAADPIRDAVARAISRLSVHLDSQGKSMAAAELRAILATSQDAVIGASDQQGDVHGFRNGIGSPEGRKAGGPRGMEREGNVAGASGPGREQQDDLAVHLHRVPSGASSVSAGQQGSVAGVTDGRAVGRLERGHGVSRDEAAGVDPTAESLQGRTPAADHAPVCEWKALSHEHFMRQCSKYPTLSAAGPYCSNCGKIIVEAR